MYRKDAWDRKSCCGEAIWIPDRVDEVDETFAAPITYCTHLAVCGGAAFSAVLLMIIMVISFVFVLKNTTKMQKAEDKNARKIERITAKYNKIAVRYNELNSGINPAELISGISDNSSVPRRSSKRTTYSRKSQSRKLQSSQLLKSQPLEKKSKKYMDSYHSPHSNYFKNLSHNYHSGHNNYNNYNSLLVPPGNSEIMHNVSGIGASAMSSSMLDSVDMSYAELDTELFEGDSFDAEFFGDSLFDTGVIDGENNHFQKSNKKDNQKIEPRKNMDNKTIAANINKFNDMRRDYTPRTVKSPRTSPLNGPAGANKFLAPKENHNFIQNKNKKEVLIKEQSTVFDYNLSQMYDDVTSPEALISSVANENSNSRGFPNENSKTITNTTVKESTVPTMNTEIYSSEFMTSEFNLEKALDSPSYISHENCSGNKYDSESIHLPTEIESEAMDAPADGANLFFIGDNDDESEVGDRSESEGEVKENCSSGNKCVADDSVEELDSVED